MVWKEERDRGEEKWEMVRGRKSVVKKGRRRSGERLREGRRKERERK